ncbi:Chaperone surA [Gossypium australe]|uniref:Chaperone surA n=1 Tax=Gossypium australe TaxID=47621 RepID=A0A5B6VNF3_9ROSI|nr:Chaperone surA [Gossypium australe]
MDPNRAIADEVESNVLAFAQGTAPSNSRLVTGSQGGEAKEAFFQMMNEWFTQYIRTNSTAKQPPPRPIPNLYPANVEDDSEKTEFWLENMTRVFDELSCTSAECLRCAISLLRDTTYQWWNTLVSVVPRERVT